MERLEAAGQVLALDLVNELASVARVLTLLGRALEVEHESQHVLHLLVELQQLRVVDDFAQSPSLEVGKQLCLEPRHVEFLGPSAPSSPLSLKQQHLLRMKLSVVPQ